MLFKKKNCSECGSSYDVVDSTCPVCKHRDENFESYGVPKNVLWLPIWKQIVIFAIGLFGLNIASIVGQFIFASLYETNYVGYIAAVNCFRYILAAGAIAAVIAHDFSRFKEHLKKWWPWLIGIGFGIALINASMIYNVIVNVFHPTTDNENQTAVVSLVDSYPVISILLLGILGPLVEEFTYRVGLYSFLRRINKYLAYAITIVIFGLIHFSFNSLFSGDSEEIINELLNLPNYMIAGFLLCLAYEKFGISCSSVAHITNNLYSIIMTLLLKWIQ